MYSIHQDIRWHHQGERKTSAEEQSQNHAITHGTAPSGENVEGRSNLSIPKIMTDWRSIPKKKVCFVLRIDCNQGSLGSQETWLLDPLFFCVEWGRSAVLGCSWNWLERLGKTWVIKRDLIRLIEVDSSSPLFQELFQQPPSPATRWQGEVIFVVCDSNAVLNVAVSCKYN